MQQYFQSKLIKISKLSTIHFKKNTHMACTHYMLPAVNSENVGKKRWEEKKQKKSDKLSF